MSLVYKRSDTNEARAYERSPGMEPNPGVSHLTVVNSGKRKRRKVSQNPLQWIEGRGQRHMHISKEYATLRQALGWKKRHPNAGAQLYPVDEKGTILSRPVSKKMLSNRRSGMTYNIGALRRAVRSNPRGRGGAVSARKTSRGVRVSSQGKQRRRVKRNTSTAYRAGHDKIWGKKAAKKRTSRKSSMTKAQRSEAAKKGWRKRRTSGSAKTIRGGKRRATGYYHGRRRISHTGNEYTDKYFAAGLMPAVARVRRSSEHRSGRPSILTYPISAGHGRLSKRKTSRASNRRRSYAIGASYGGARKRRMTANKRRRTSKRRRASNRRRTSGRPGLYRNRRRSSRRASRRRGSRRRLTRNMLAASKVKYVGRGKNRMGRASGRLYQMVEYGTKSRGRPNKGGTRKMLTGYPVLVPSSVSLNAYVRKYRFGGAAKDAHKRALTSGYAEHKKSSRRRGIAKNRRTSMRRNSRRRTTRNPRYVVMNRRHRKSSRKGRRRVRRNPFGADLMTDVLTPVAGGTAGFVAARFLSNGIANVAGIRDILDKGKEAATAENTKLAANALGILATLGLATKVDMIRRHRGALITGMGLALTDRLLRRVTGKTADYLGGFGEYVSSPLGEYVNQPLGAYVQTPGFGEYVNQPLSGMGDTLYAAAGAEYATAGYAEGVDPANQSGVDGMMDVMEAAAGMGDTLYAAAGMGEEEQPPFVSTQTPTSQALEVDTTMPYSRPVPSGLVTPEGRGYAGGLFARNLFAGML